MKPITRAVMFLSLPWIVAGVLAMAEHLPSQEEEVPRREAAVDEDPLGAIRRSLDKIEADRERLGDEIDKRRWRAHLGDALLEKYKEPLARWLEAPNLVEPFALDKERWYALGVVHSNRAYAGVWVKFKLHFDAEKRCYGQDSQGHDVYEAVMDYVRARADRATAAFSEKILLAFQQDIPEAQQVITFGTAHLIRLPTEHSDPDKFRKEDVIYRSE